MNFVIFDQRILQNIWSFTVTGGSRRPVLLDKLMLQLKKKYEIDHIFYFRIDTESAITRIQNRKFILVDLIIIQVISYTKNYKK